ncbi:MAG: amino acid transporter [Acidobacteria bacterium]|nr:amino acid transporter [Acidobacteriota bacterium]
MRNSKPSWLRKWLYDGTPEIEGPGEPEGRHHQNPWWKVMCLTGLDYFSTLGYQPGIAFLAAGIISPVATLILVLLTLFGALPVYSRVARESPHGEGSIAMLENLLSRWKGKLFVLALLGFVATDFVITITLSSADATAHILENPFVHQTLPWLDHPVAVTFVLIALLGAVFLKGFREAIGIAVVLVGIYLALNAVVITAGVYEVLTHPSALANWQNALWTTKMSLGSWHIAGAAGIFLMSITSFPKLALGLSGFETGVAVMPLIKGPNRIGNTRKLLISAAVIMSILLIASSLATSVLIEPKEFCPRVDCGSDIFEHSVPEYCSCTADQIAAGVTTDGGKANGRALAYIAHRYLGDIFGTIYDLSTILILWFAGASAMAGLLNIVPRYLPRYGMAPEWARATRPLTLVFTAICFAVTWIFEANVDAQGGAYATGVLVLISSAAIAVTLSARRRRSKWTWAFWIVSIVFAYTTVANMFERPDGLKIAMIFITAIIVSSFISRAMRSTEIRIDKIELDPAAKSFIDELNDEGELRIVTNRRETGDMTEYRFKEHEKRVDNHIPSSDPILFYEIEPGDSSEFKGRLFIRGVDVDGYRILRTQAPAVPNAIAAFLLYLRDKTGKIPHVYFGWSEGNPIMYLARYILFGEGDTAPVTREILRQAEEDPELRPNVHVGG